MRGGGKKTVLPNLPKEWVGFHISGFHFGESGGREQRLYTPGSGESLSLREFVELTTSLTLEPWQVGLVYRFEFIVKKTTAVC